jgi:hypothetical protein
VSAFPKKSPGKCFSGVIFFSGWIVFTFFSFDFFCALVKRLSVKGTQRRDNKYFDDKYFGRFVSCLFGAFLDKGSSKTRLKKIRGGPSVLWGASSPVRCARAGAERRGGGLCADPACEVILGKKKSRDRACTKFQTKQSTYVHCFLFSIWFLFFFCCPLPGP